MVRLKETILVRPKFFKFGFEKLVFVSSDGFFVEYQNIRNIIFMNL